MLEKHIRLTSDMRKVLQDLIDLNVECRDGFVDAAEQADDLTTEGLFRDLADTQQDHIEKLEGLMGRSRISDRADGKILSAIVKMWREVDSSFGARSAKWNDAREVAGYLKQRYDSAMRLCSGTDAAHSPASIPPSPA